MSALALVARLACVFGLLALVLWLLRRTGGLRARTGAPLQVLSTTRLGKSAALSVVRVHDEEYVLGVSGAGVTVVSSRRSPQAGSAPLPAGVVDGSVVPAPGRGRRIAPSAPPSSAQFLRSSWEVLRRRPVEASDVDTGALRTALATAIAIGSPKPGTAVVPAGPAATTASTATTSGTTDTTGTTGFAEELAAALAAPALPSGDAPSPTAADGPATTPARRAPRRPRYGTDATPREEQATWSPTHPDVRASEQATAPS